MAKILGIHFRNTPNVGDRVCCPLDYFDLSDNNRHSVHIADLNDYCDPADWDVVILGGGALGTGFTSGRGFLMRG